MTKRPDTYDRRIQLKASRRRREDAEKLHATQRWAGAIYLGGYAIECSLKSLICYNERTNNFKETRLWKSGVTGASLHDLTQLINQLPEIQRFIANDRTNTYKPAWKTVSDLWQKDELRYGGEQGQEADSARFIDAIQKLHRLILERQGEAS